VVNLSKTLHANFYQNRSTFAEVMHKSISVCFLWPSVYMGSLSCSIASCTHSWHQHRPTRLLAMHCSSKPAQH